MSNSHGVVVCFPERHLARLVEVNLARQGYEVESVRSSREVVRLLDQRTKIDCFVLDGELADPDTRELVRIIRGDERHRHARIVVCGSDDDFGDSDIWLTKPGCRFDDLFRGGPPPAFA